jgi:hypothetical protein
MKPHIILCLLLAVPLACKDEGTAPSQAPLAKLFEIHLQTGFSHSPVSVTIDRAQLFHDTVTTLSVLSLGAIVPAQVAQGTHRLNVTILGTSSRDTTFTISDTLFVGVNYSATSNTIGYTFQRNRFYYR